MVGAQLRLHVDQTDRLRFPCGFSSHENLSHAHSRASSRERGWTDFFSRLVKELDFNSHQPYNQQAQAASLSKISNRPTIQMLSKIESRLRRELFLTTRIGVFINPYYIVRRGLYKEISTIAPKIHGEVLDFGCGRKPYESLFTGVNSYTGVDIAASGHDHTNSRIDVFYDGRKLPFNNDRFDAVVSFEVFEHIFNIDDIMPEIMRVLKPGGMFVTSTPFLWEEHEQPYDFGRYSSFGLPHILTRHGFVMESTRKTNGTFLAISSLFVEYLRRTLCPSSKRLFPMYHLLVTTPLLLCIYALNWVMPKNYDLYSSLVIISRKPN
jgi:SAM-dependent methyltransferase